jgi:hypothetical protein
VLLQLVPRDGTIASQVTTSDSVHEEKGARLPLPNLASVKSTLLTSSKSLVESRVQSLVCSRVSNLLT